MELRLLFGLQMEDLECPDALWVITGPLQGERSERYIMRRTWLLALKTEGENHKPGTQTELEAGQGKRTTIPIATRKRQPWCCLHVSPTEVRGLLKEAQINQSGLSGPLSLRWFLAAAENTKQLRCHGQWGDSPGSEDLGWPWTKGRFL